jgi:hypothetical protein
MKYFEPLTVQTDSNGYPIAIQLPRFPPKQVQTISVEAQPGRTVFVASGADQSYRLHRQVNDVWVLENERNPGSSRKQEAVKPPTSKDTPPVPGQEHLSKYLKRLPEEERVLALSRIKEQRGKIQEWVDYCEDNWRDRAK